VYPAVVLLAEVNGLCVTVAKGLPPQREAQQHTKADSTTI